MAVKSNIIKLNDVRMSFPHIFSPQVSEDGKKSYGASFIFAPEHPATSIIKKEIVRVAKEKWGAKADAVLKTLKASNKLCIKDGDTKEYDGYPGNLFVSSTNKTRPKVFNRAAEMLTEGADGTPYAGCYVNASLDIWAMDNKFGKRVNASLRGVQFLRDGESFGGGSVAKDDEFGALEEGADDDTDMDEEDLI